MASRSLNQLAKELRAESWDVILDMHNILRGNLLLALMGQKPHSKLDKDTVARLTLMRTGRQNSSLQRSMDDRFQQVVEKMPGSRSALGRLLQR